MITEVFYRVQTIFTKQNTASYWAQFNILHYLFKLTEEDKLLWCEVILQWASCREAAENMKAFCLIQFALGVRKQKHILCAETVAFYNDF